MPTSVGTTESSGGPLPPAPTPNIGDKGKDKCKGKDKGKGKGKSNGSGGSGNNSGSNNTSMWLSFYNPWTDTISMWSGMCPPQ
jgi:hypothetical protein